MILYYMMNNENKATASLIVKTIQNDLLNLILN